MLPFILGDKIPDGDPKFKIFTLLIQMTFLVTSPCVSQHTVNDLELLISEYHSKFVTAEYPKANFTSQMHYMLHLPNQIAQYGPARYHWCMRFELNSFFHRHEMEKFQKSPQ